MGGIVERIISNLVNRAKGLDDIYDLAVAGNNLWYSSFSSIASAINDMEVLSMVVYDINNKIDDDDIASVFDNVNLTAERGATIFDRSDLTAAKGASICDSANLTADKGASIFDRSDLTAAKGASIFDSANLTAAKGASIFDSANLTAAKGASIFDSANLTAAKGASIFDSANLTAAKSASIFNETALTAAKGASIFDNTNLTSAKLISILDNANILSANIKSIFETGSLSVDEKRAAVLEGDQYAAADAAASVEGSFYTDDQLALAFDNTNLTAAKGASIFNETALTAAKGASIFNETALTAAKGASIFNETALSIAKINDIIIHANITDDKAQQILSEIAKPDRDLTSADNIYEILDDWDDNKLTARDGAETTPTGFTNLFAQKDKFRPEWTQVTGTTAVSSGQVVLDENSEEIRIPSAQVAGTWELDFQLTVTGGSDFDALLRFMNDTSDYYNVNIRENGAIYIQKNAVGSLIAASWTADTNTHTAKVTRDSDGNMELFLDGASKGTATDNTITSSTYLNIHGGHHTCYVDNLKVY